MKKILCTAFIFFIFSLTASAKHEFKEKEYQKYWCDKRGGQIEYKLDDKTRIDCLTPTLAVEFDFAPKWHECIGQALYYGKKTKRIPACVLILENEDDIRFVKRLRYTVYQKKKIPYFQTFTINKKVFRSPEEGVVRDYVDWGTVSRFISSNVCK